MSFRAKVVFGLTVLQLLLYPTVICSNYNSTTNSPSGAEFLQNVIGTLHRPNRRMIDKRIDVAEHIPNDVPYPSNGDELKILSKQPNNFNYNGGQNIEMNNPATADDNQNKIAPILSQIIPQFFKNDYPDTHPKILNSPGSSGPQQYGQESSDLQGSIGPQQFNSNPGNSQIPQHVLEALAGDSAKPDGTIPGYNYYFYPLNSQELQQLQNGNGVQQQDAGGQKPTTDLDTMSSNHQMSKPKVEPLFVAMAGFVGVAVVFLSALMFIPRLPIPILSSKGALKRAPEELASLTKLVAESIDGKDCSERIACEVGRAMRSMQVGSKPIRMMEIILPPSVAKQLAQIRRAATRKEQCHFIMCKKTEGTLKMVAKLKKTNQKTITDVRDMFKM